MSETGDEFPYEYATSVESSMMLMCEMERIVRREKWKKIIPALAKELVNAGVDFSKVDFSKIDGLDFDSLFDEAEL